MKDKHTVNQGVGWFNTSVQPNARLPMKYLEESGEFFFYNIIKKKGR